MFYLVPVILFYITLALFLFLYIKPVHAKNKWLLALYFCLVALIITMFIWGFLRNFSPPDWAK